MHMLSGKAIARAVRAHLIVDAVLNALVLAKTFCVPLPGSSHDTECEDKRWNPHHFTTRLLEMQTWMVLLSSTRS